MGIQNEQPGKNLSTALVLASLAKAWPESLSTGHRADLEALARKIHVAKTVMATYATGWKKVKNAEPLAVEHWPLLVAVFLAYTNYFSVSNNDDRGLALKNLNAGLAAIDKGLEFGFKDAELENWAHMILARVTQGEE